MTSPPFSLPDPYQGLATITGSAHVDGVTLRIEFQAQDALVGLLKGDVTGVAIPLDEVEAVDLRRGVFRSRLGVTLRSQRLASEIPGSQGAEVRLRFGRTHRDAAEAFYEVLADALAEGDPA